MEDDFFDPITFASVGTTLPREEPGLPCFPDTIRLHHFENTETGERGFIEEQADGTYSCLIGWSEIKGATFEEARAFLIRNYLF